MHESEHPESVGVADPPAAADAGHAPGLIRRLRRGRQAPITVQEVPAYPVSAGDGPAVVPFERDAAFGQVKAGLADVLAAQLDLADRFDVTASALAATEAAMAANRRLASALEAALERASVAEARVVAAEARSERAEGELAQVRAALAARQSRGFRARVARIIDPAR